MAMLFLAGIVSVLLVGFIAYLAVSRETSRVVKKAAVAALIVIGLALAGCSIALVMLLGFSSGEGSPANADLRIIPVKPAGYQNLVPILIFALIIIAVIALIIFVSLRSQRKIQERLRTAKYAAHDG
jgi:hypothetical protein